MSMPAPGPWRQKALGAAARGRRARATDGHSGPRATKREVGGPFSWVAVRCRRASAQAALS